MSKPKLAKRVRIEPGLIETKTSWSDSTLTFIGWNDKGQRVEAVITIHAPWSLAYLRRELDKIANYWREKAA